MTHRFFALSVGVLTFTLIVLSVASAADQNANSDDSARNQPKATETRENTQKIEIVGNQSGNVKVGNIVQNQSGRNGHQQISIGNAKGGEGHANVVVGNIVQNQKGGTSQKVEIGKGSGAQVGDIIQNGGENRKTETGSP